MATSVLTSRQPQSNSLVKKYPLTTFFLLVFGLTWPFMIVDALGSQEILPFRLPLPLLIVMGYMPTLAAVIVAGLTKGKEGIKHLFRKLLIARVGFRWYLFAIFGMAVTSYLSIVLANLTGLLPPLPILSEKMPPFASPVEFLLNILILFLVAGIVNGEELAWRGFALPRLQSKYNALTSSLIVGVFWTLFHLPLFFTLTGSSQANMPFVGFALSTLSLSIFFTWMYNNTRGSVLLAYILHASANTWTRIFSIDSGNEVQFWIGTSLMLILALFVVKMAGAENLSRNHVRIQEEP